MSGRQSAIADFPQPSQDTALSENTTNSDIVQLHHDSTTLSNILNRAGLLEIMEKWQGKALLVALNSAQIPQAYHYNSIYRDSNNNGLQDPEDTGFFNPASTVKVSLAALVLETLNESGLARQAEYRIAGTRHWYRFEDDIRRALVISDNDATNRLILWLGFDQINRSLANKELSRLAINRLMLDKGTLIPSPPFEIRFNGEIVQQPEKPVTIDAACYETRKKIGNCATAEHLIQGFMQINQPEYFSPDVGFSLSLSDRRWLQLLMSHTPREEGFDYDDDYCRFLTALENQVASHSGKMLSKCGVSLFTNTYTDLSYLETDTGQRYYILLSVSPPSNVPEPEILDQMSRIAEYILVAPL